MRISDWSSDVCSSDLSVPLLAHVAEGCLIGQERPRDVDRHEHVPVVIGDILRIDVTLDSCRIDEPVDAAHRPCTALERRIDRSEEHTSELQSLMRISYAVFCLKKKNTILNINILQSLSIKQK